MPGFQRMVQNMTGIQPREYVVDPDEVPPCPLSLLGALEYRRPCKTTRVRVRVHTVLSWIDAPKP